MSFAVDEILDKAIFKRLLFLAVVISSLHTFHVFFFKENPGIRVWVSPLISLIIFAFYILFSKIRNFEKYKISFFPFLVSFIMFGFLSNNGLWGMFPFEATILIVFTICMYKGLWMSIFLTVDAFFVIICCWIQYYHPEWAPINQAPNFDWLGIFDIASRIFVIASMVWVMKSEYNRNLNRTILLNEELEQKNKQINDQRNKILEINSNLSSMVNERTRKLESANKQLTDYAFFNSHNVRGPLARIIGIVNLIKLHKENITLKDPELRGYFGHLEQSTTDLDKVIKDINNILKDH